MSVTDLTIYRKSLLLIKDIYLFIRRNPKLQKDYSLCDQLKRASISVSANISEGYMQGKKIFKNYLRIACGSANETITLLEIIVTVHEIPTQKLQEDYKYLAKQINAFSTSFN